MNAETLLLTTATEAHFSAFKNKFNVLKPEYPFFHIEQGGI